MPIVKISEIIIAENRQRRFFPEKEQKELVNSIVSKGLFHPILVRQIGIDQYLLVAGERRLKALTSIAEAGVSFIHNNKAIPPGQIPVTHLGELEEYDLREAELEENILRVDLTWQERARAVADLADLRRAQAQEEGETCTISDIASEVAGRKVEGSAVTAISETLLVAKHLDDPEVQQAQNIKEAFKIIKKKAEAEHRKTLAATYAESGSTHTVHHGSAFNFAPSLPEGRYTCIVTDPPYGVNADKFGEQGDGHNYKDDIAFATECVTLIAKEGFRVTKENAHCYMFLDISNFEAFKLIFQLHGWNVWATPLIWYKRTGILPSPEYGPRRTYEAILYARKGRHSVKFVKDDVLVYHAVRQGKLHAAQKPVDLYVDLLSRSCNPGDLVLDLFMGSGTIFPAANTLSLQATGCDDNEDCYHMALSRQGETEELTGLDEFEEATISTLIEGLAQ